jgi:hypothetical protein
MQLVHLGLALALGCRFSALGFQIRGPWVHIAATCEYLPFVLEIEGPGCREGAQSNKQARGPPHHKVNGPPDHRSRHLVDRQAGAGYVLLIFRKRLSDYLYSHTGISRLARALI